MSVAAPISTTQKAVVLFDGQCQLCQRSVAILNRLDWLGRLDFRDARDPANVPPEAQHIKSKRFMDEMHLVPPGGGRVYAGFQAFRWMAGRLPALWLMWPFLFVPGVPWVGQKVYLWIAKNRFHLVPCHDGQCAVPLKKN